MERAIEVRDTLATGCHVQLQPNPHTLYGGGRDMGMLLRIGTCLGVLSTEVSYRYDTGRPELAGEARLSDVRSADNTFQSYLGAVDLIITSPPYLDTTHVQEDQWLRNWFVGGKSRPSDIKRGDDRYTSQGQYWKFLTEAWKGIVGLLSKRDVVIVVRIGSSKLSFEEARDGLLESLVSGIDRDVSLRSASTSDIVRSQARSFRPNAVGIKREYDFVSVVHAV